MIAVELDKMNAVKDLLRQDLDVNTVVNGTNAINLAYENNFEEIVLELLNFNSMFPLNFNPTKITNLKLREFAEVTEQFHDLIVNADNAKITEILESNPNLRYF